MNHPIVHIVKYGTVALIWMGVLGFAIAIVVMGGNSGSVISLGIASFVTAAISTGSILRSSRFEQYAPPEQIDYAKRKNDQRGLDPMSLLTDADIEELRRDYKDTLRRRMLEDAGEPASFEALLSDRDSRKRR